MIEQLNTVARLWWSWSTAMFWQVGLLILLIATIDRLTRRWAWPQLRYALWSLILVKLLLPPSLSLPSGIVPGLAPVARKALARLESPVCSVPVRASRETPHGVTTNGSRVLFSLNEDLLGVGSVPAGASRSTGILPVSSMGGTLMNLTDLHGQSLPSTRSGDARATHGRDAHATETPYGVTTNKFLGANAEAPSTVLRSLSSVIAWQVYPMMASFAGTLILGIWLFLRLHSLVGRHSQVAAAASLPQSFYNQLAGCARRLELRCIPRVVVTRRLATPAVFGVFRPVLLMPKGYLSKLSRRDTEHMLLHELAHIKRGDLIAHSLYMLLQVVYWYNPLLWLVRRQVHHLRELSCDATVAELLRERTSAYRQTLLETARRLLTSSVEPGLGLLGLFEDSNRLLVRLNWLTKPTWRYRTMKRVTVATIAALMLACVLPMARAQEAASNEQSPTVVREGVEPDAQRPFGPRPPSKRGQDARDTDDDAAQDIASLEARLQELMTQQQQLQKQLQALMQQRGQSPVKIKPKPPEPPAVARPHVEKTPGRREVTVVPWQGKEPTEEQRRALRDAQVKRAQAQTEQRLAQAKQERARMEQEKAQVGQQRAQMEVGRATIEKEKAKVEVERHKSLAKQMEKWAESEQMQQWQAKIEEWQNSEEMKRWQQEVEEWGRELGRRYEQNAEGLDDEPESPDSAPMPAMPPMPPMPAMPVMPAMPEMPMNLNIDIESAPTSPDPMVPPVYGSADSVARVPHVTHQPGRISQPAVPAVPPAPARVPSTNVHVDATVPHVSVSPRPQPRVHVTVPHANVPAEVAEMAAVPPAPPAPPKGPEHVVSCGDFVVKSLPAGAVLQVENNVGSIVVEGTDSSDCAITATADIRGVDREEARRIAEGILVQVTPADGRVRVGVELPKDLDKEQRNRIAINFQIALPREANVQAVQKVGNVSLSSLRGDVKATVEVGMIRTWNLQGDAALRINVGDINFATSADLSAKVRAQTQIGSISSDLPLEITGAAAVRSGSAQIALGSHATGTLGEGRHKIDLTANTGSIRIQRQSAPPKQEVF